MKLPPDVEFHDDIRLLIYRPRGVIDEAAVKRVVDVLEDLEAKLQKPFNRFSDTLAADEVELNFKYVIQVSLYRVLSYGDRPPVKSAILATDSTIGHYFQLHAIILLRTPRSTFEYFKNEKLPPNGSACRSSGWRRNSPPVEK